MLARLIPLGLALLAASACTTTGTGEGTLRNGVEMPVAFQWKSTDSISGTMTATLSDGRSFTGQYFQITSDARVDRLSPLWDGWHPGWRGWRY